MESLTMWYEVFDYPKVVYCDRCGLPLTEEETLNGETLCVRCFYEGGGDEE